MPPVEVRVPGLLARFTDDDRRVTVEAETVREAVLELVECHPQLESHLLNGDGELRLHVQVFHGKQQVDWAETRNVLLDEEDVVAVVQAVSGG